MAKNILDYSIAKKINKNIHEANSQKNETIRALKEKNEEKLTKWQLRAVEQRKLNERERRQIQKLHKQNDQKLVQIENMK